MSESLVGSVPILDWSVSGVIDVHGFEKDTGAVFFVSERSGVMQSDIELELSQFLTGQPYFITSTQLWDGGAGGDSASAEPVLTTTNGFMSDSLILNIELDAWATQRIEITYIGDGADAVVGRHGSDTIETLGGADTVDAGNGDDTIDGGNGDDQIFAGAGNDTIIDSGGSDHVVGGTGYDSVVYEGDVDQYSVLYDAISNTSGALRVMDAVGNIDWMSEVEDFGFNNQSLTAQKIHTYLQNEFGELDAGDTASYQVSLAEIAAAPVLPQALLEVGRTSIEQLHDDYWQSVSFSQSIADAAVVMGPASSQGGASYTVRVRNVTETGFEFQIDEWDYLDGSHVELDISWLAGTKGLHDLEDGSNIRLGSIESTSLDRESVELEGFEEVPMIFGQLSGAEETTAITHRIDDVAADELELQIQVDESIGAIRESIEETTFSFAALDVAADGFIFSSGTMATHNTYQSTSGHLEAHEGLFADMQTFQDEDPSIVRYKTTGNQGVSLKIEEEISMDLEVLHTDEGVAWVILEQGIYDFV